MGKVQIHVQAHCTWDGMTRLLNLFASNDLATFAVMSDTNEGVRSVSRLPSKQSKLEKAPVTVKPRKHSEL